MIRKIAIVAGVLFLSMLAKADTVYDNTSLVNAGIASLGFNSSLGQTFSAPAGSTSLSSFSLWLSGGAAGDVEGVLATWTGSQAGTILYTSSPVAISPGTIELTFDPNVSVAQGDDYVAFLTINTPYLSSFSGGFFGGDLMQAYFPGGSIPGGHFVWDDGDSSLWTTQPWFSFGGNQYDAEFVADFATRGGAVPEPSSLLLLGSGILAGLADTFRRRVKA